MSEARLITIGISHYCEKARWALERADVPYVEERHLQGFHHYYARRAGKGWTTPTLILPDGEVLGQSSEILDWADTQLPPERRLYPPDVAGRVRAIEKWLGLTLGPDGRAWMYGYMLDDPQLVAEHAVRDIPEFEKRSFRTALRFFKPYLALRVRLQGTNPDIDGIRGIFDEIAARMEDGRRFMFGDQFTAADLSFAAFSAPLILPAKYGAELPTVEDLSPAMRDAVESMREHPAGQFAARVIELERPTPPWMVAKVGSAPSPAPVAS